jgi:HAD superfamily hydrolase (TIGR01549 family)
MMLFFDVGETLASEERWLSSWADWLEVPKPAFFAALGALIEARRSHQELFTLLRPGIDMTAEREKRRARGISDHFIAADVYPDALPALQWAKQAGHRIGIAGNNSASTEAFTRGLGLADVVGSSERWGVTKPDPAFFQRLIAEAGCAPGEIVYIGDRVDNDVLPARAAGLTAIHIARGPWGVVQARWPEAQGLPRIHSLAELPAMLAAS